jgi:hypothetical protein
MKKRINFLSMALPVVVVVPLLVASYFIGPASIWFWAGIGVGMAVFNYFIKDNQPTPETPEPAEGAKREPIFM